MGDRKQKIQQRREEKGTARTMVTAMYPEVVEGNWSRSGGPRRDLFNKVKLRVSLSYIYGEEESLELN